MVLYVIIFLSLLFLVFNYYICNKDFLAPSMIFILMFLVQSIMCLIATSYLNIIFHTEVLGLLLGSYLIFTFFNIYNAVIIDRKMNSFKNMTTVVSSKLSFLKLSSWVSWLFNILSVFLIYSNYRFLQRLSNAYGGSRSLSEMISLYDNLVKFRPEIYRSLAVHRPFYYTALSMLVLAGSYLTVYVIVNNFIVTKRVKWSQILTVILLVIGMYFSGSRSPIFRVMTFTAFIYYALSVRNGLQIFQKRKIFRKFIRWAIVLIILFLSTLSLYGRTNSYNIFHYLFIYFGAPLWNLDTFIQNYDLPRLTEVFGEQTFISFYNSFLKSGFLLNLPFVRANATYGLGNVYTTFYQFLYDFGWFGVVPLVTILAGYYSISYRKIMEAKSAINFDFSLFVYAYLFNDLVMLFFSNRFYETILNKQNLTMLVLAFIMGGILFNRGIKLGTFKLTLKK
ncbi:O-antigen polymerase [Streptococcus cuniculipharyngis]|uniref:Oligosaccharide repeat unit polymerase n=1 Tax=Streptococcus cuniculipharyngis TaxID=1562651 RepID=A0A5C5SCY1_9STRE|nr:O-antigen polymerase [Streptococcus cuniculipharyngis]TWS97644.1 oligosaccharide repeat unit polymerase [Streptococcus cuniculipharyngis]